VIFGDLDDFSIFGEVLLGIGKGTNEEDGVVLVDEGFNPFVLEIRGKYFAKEGSMSVLSGVDCIHF